jgi:hypothetical protein
LPIQSPGDAHVLTKFIIIDNSVVDTAGHHYQYAAHCLKAAAKLGHDCVLAVNKSYSSSPYPQTSQEWKTLPVYSYGFWETRDSALVNSLLYLDRVFSTKLNQQKYKFMFSWLGFSWQNRNQLLSKSNLPGQGSLKNPLGWIILSSLMVPIFVASTRITNRLNKGKAAFMSLYSRRQRDPITGTRIEDKRSKIFYKDTRALFHRIKLKKGDIVFVPTVGLTELLGFLGYLQKEPDSKLASWHMLFRRNVYSGREPEYWRQDENLRFLRNTLLHFTQSLEGHRIFFYTDTEELTSQYNRLGISAFNTLPVPHTVSASSDEPGAHGKDNSPLVATYLGDARTEKGYNFLPQIINDLWSNYVLPGKVRFVLQSNFNTPKGEPKIVVARSELESLPKENVKLIYKALTFEEYTKTLMETDIMLMPYQPDNYYARSSGILVECLAAGIPVVVPAATWLSRQFIREIYRHQESLQKKMNVIQHFSESDILWKRWNSYLNPFVNGELTFGGETTKAYCWLNRPMASRHLYVSFALNAPIGSCIRVDLAQLRHDNTTAKFRSEIVETLNGNEEADDNEAGGKTGASTALSSRNDGLYYSVLVPLESECHRIWLGFKNAYGNNVMRLARISVSFLEPRNDSKGLLPMGAVGLAYDKPYEISGLLRDIIDNYQHYRRTALEFSREYLRVHNAEHLVQEIDNNVKTASI